MAEGKKIVNIYVEWIEIFENLSDEQAGKLVKHLFRYVNDQNPELNDKLINMAFIPIKQQLKRDLKKWEMICERNKINGKKGGRPNKPKKPNGLFGNPNKPKKPDKDKDKDKDKDILNKQNKFKDEVREFKGKYEDKLLKDFYLYWSEPTEKKDKMRKELEKTWDTSRRLNTWFNRSNK